MRTTILAAAVLLLTVQPALSDESEDRRHLAALVIADPAAAVEHLSGSRSKLSTAEGEAARAVIDRLEDEAGRALTTDEVIVHLLRSERDSRTRCRRAIGLMEQETLLGPRLIMVQQRITEDPKARLRVLRASPERIFLEVSFEVVPAEGAARAFAIKTDLDDQLGTVGGPVALAKEQPEDADRCRVSWKHLFSRQPELPPGFGRSALPPVEAVDRAYLLRAARSIRSWQALVRDFEDRLFVSDGNYEKLRERLLSYVHRQRTEADVANDLPFGFFTGPPRIHPRKMLPATFNKEDDCRFEDVSPYSGFHFTLPMRGSESDMVLLTQRLETGDHAAVVEMLELQWHPDGVYDGWLHFDLMMKR